MISSVRITAGLLVLLAGLVGSGCVPSAQSQLDEEKEPHFLAGKSCSGALDYQGAVEAFEKALEVNPRSASAHFELGYLFNEKIPRPASAVYHFEEYLKLRPKAENADLVRQRILSCKQQLASTVSLGPVAEKLQRDFDQMAQENKRLREDLEKVRAYAAWLETLTNHTGGARVAAPPSTLAGPTSATGSGPRASPAAATETAPAAAASSRTHTVKAGETPILIARKYGVKLEALLASNPRLDPRKLKVGQTLNIPGS
jgi:tetratricopeptide (TPR) repeat protein